MLERSEAFNSQDNVGCIPVANYSEIFNAEMHELFEDMKTGPAAFITLQTVTKAQYDEFLQVNAENDYFFLTARTKSENLFLAKKNRCRSIEKSYADAVIFDDKVVVHMSVVRVMLQVPLCNMSSIAIANVELTDFMQGRDLEHVAESIAEMVLTYDVRIMGGKFGQYLVPLISTLRGDGILVNVAAWLPFRTVEQNGEETLWLHDSNILIFGAFQD